MKKIRICVIDDQNVVREGLVALLSFQSDIEVVGQAEDGIKGLALIQQTNPDVVLLDMVMPRQDGLTTLLKMKELHITSRVLVLTSFSEGERVRSAIKAGAMGYMVKDATREQLLQAIHDVAEGRAALHSSITLKFINEFNKPVEKPAETEKLTPREKSTLVLLAQGLSNQEIAVSLFINERTAAKYVSNILLKLHLANRTQAAIYQMHRETTELNAQES